MKSIETKRFILRKVKIDDAEKIYKIQYYYIMNTFKNQAFLPFFVISNLLKKVFNYNRTSF